MIVLNITWKAISSNTTVQQDSEIYGMQTEACEMGQCELIKFISTNLQQYVRIPPPA